MIAHSSSPRSTCRVQVTPHVLHGACKAGSHALQQTCVPGHPRKPCHVRRRPSYAIICDDDGARLEVPDFALQPLPEPRSPLMPPASPPPAIAAPSPSASAPIQDADLADGARRAPSSYLEDSFNVSTCSCARSCRQIGYVGFCIRCLAKGIAVVFACAAPSAAAGSRPRRCTRPPRRAARRLPWAPTRSRLHRRPHRPPSRPLGPRRCQVGGLRSM